MFSARAYSKWFFSSRPANILILGAAIALSTSTIIAMFWPISRPDGVLTIGLVINKPYTLILFVWIWSLIWAFIVDGAKVFFIYCAVKYNLFDINNTGQMILTSEAITIKEQLISDNSIEKKKA